MNRSALSRVPLALLLAVPLAPDESGRCRATIAFSSGAAAGTPAKSRGRSV